MVSVELKDEEKSVEIMLEWPDSIKAVCPDCGRPCAVYDHAGLRWWRHLDTMNRTTRLCCRVPRSDCPEHGVKTMEVPWASGSSKFTMEFESQAIDVLLLARSQTQAANHLELSWKQVHNIQEQSVNRGLARRSTDEITRVGLDEKSFGRHHHYGTVLSDLDHKLQVTKYLGHEPYDAFVRHSEILQTILVRVLHAGSSDASFSRSHSESPKASHCS